MSHFNAARKVVIALACLAAVPLGASPRQFIAKVLHAGGGGCTPGYTSPDGSSTSIASLLNTAPAGTTVCFPTSGGTYHWTAQMNAAPAANVTLLGAGSLSTTGGGDVTSVIDEYDSTNSVIYISLPATGTFRMAGFSVHGSGSVTHSHQEGNLQFWGPGSMRLDHMHIVADYSDPGNWNSKIYQTNGGITGVMDHSIIEVAGSGAIYLNSQGASGRGDESWAAATNAGSQDGYFYIEDNIIKGDAANYASRAVDCYSACRGVLRFNTLQGATAWETHGTGHSVDNRGSRAMEVYGNTSDLASGQTVPNAVMADVGAGTGIIWGNTAGTESVKNVFDFKLTRSNNDAYNISPDPANWGYCAGTLTTGTVNVTDTGGGVYTTVTKTAGTNFNTSWAAGEMIVVGGAACKASASPFTSDQCRIASVSSTSVLILQDTAGGALTGQTYSVGSPWDGNTDAVGYPCLDQPGRGVGSLTPNANFPSKTPAAWPSQALEPIYYWANTGTPSGAYGGAFLSDQTVGRMSANRDYYAQATTAQSSADNCTTTCSPFNGTSGTGWGRILQRPTTCTVGVGYWATDEGSWNTSTTNPYGVQQSGADGKMYVCTSTNTWTARYGGGTGNTSGEPLAYPHPLRGGS